jgi:TrmH family RNA methyltransferase
VRSSAGSVLRVPVVQLDTLEAASAALRAAGARMVGTDVREGEPHDGGVLDAPVAIVLGSEPHGLDRADTDVDAWVRIDMPGNTESLNVAMAGTLLAYEARRGCAR